MWLSYVLPGIKLSDSLPHRTMAVFISHRFSQDSVPPAQCQLFFSSCFSWWGCGGWTLWAESGGLLSKACGQPSGIAELAFSVWEDKGKVECVPPSPLAFPVSQPWN